jgi:multicomponent Na+:H+ antiporter subunit C
MAVGIYSLATKRNLIKIIIGLSIITYAINLLLVLIGYRTGGHAPIEAPDRVIGEMVDPIPQVIAHTSIVIGLATTLLLVALAIRLYEKYGTFDVTKIRKLRG